MANIDTRHSTAAAETDMRIVHALRAALSAGRVVGYQCETITVTFPMSRWNALMAELNAD